MSLTNTKTSYRLLLCATCALLCLPVIFTSYVPLVDYPNHLARAHILHSYDQVPAFEAEYRLALEPLPNLALDLIVPFLLRFFGLLTAGKIFLCLTVLLFVAGCHRLGSAIQGGPAWLALPCCFFVYNSMLLYGFVNYVFGVGLFCVTLSYWLAWRGRFGASRFVLVALLTLCTYLAHLSAYSFLGVSFVAVTAWDFFVAKKETWQRVALGLAPLVPPLALFVTFMRRGGGGAMEWNTLRGKLLGPLAVVLTYNYVADAFVLAALVFIAYFAARRASRVGVEWPTFAAGAAFALLYVISPNVALNGSGVDARFVLPCALLTLLSLKLELPAGAARALLLAALAVSFVRVGLIWKTWGSLSARVGAEVSRLGALPEGARVYPLVALPQGAQQNKLERPFVHVVHYATAERRAVVPTLFTIAGQQPLGFRARPRFVEPPSYDAEGWRQLSPLWLAYLDDYDYLWAYGADDSLRALIEGRCTKVYDADGFSLWRVNHRR